MNKYYLYGAAGLAALILFAAAIFAGFAALVKLLYPLCSTLAAAAAVVFVAVIVPISLVKRFRARMALITFVLSTVCAVSVWMYSFLVILGYLGWLAIAVSFLFRLAAPVAVVVLLIYEQWQQAGILAAGALIAYVMRRYSAWLGYAPRGVFMDQGKGQSQSRGGGKGRGVIDTTAEVTDV